MLPFVFEKLGGQANGRRKENIPNPGRAAAGGRRPKKKKAPPPSAPAPEEPPQPRDATRAEKGEIVYLKLSELFPFKDHPFGVRDDAEMKGLVESVKDNGVHQPALVRPREGGGYEIIAGKRAGRLQKYALYRPQHDG